MSEQTEATSSSSDLGSASASADRPIQLDDQDKLGRLPFARALAAEISAAPLDGYVIGVVGKWGSGKTSLINLALRSLASETNTVLRFDPWLFAGGEQLAVRFFQELTAQLSEGRDSRLSTLADKMRAYGRTVEPLGKLPAIGGWIAGSGSASNFIGNLLRRPKALVSAQTTRKDLEALLKDRKQRLVIVLDDIDRLNSPEIIEIVRLVRAVADFPNTVYVLAFDAARIASALGSGDEATGRAYLEKIVQVTYAVPEVRRSDLAALLLADLGEVLEGLTTGPFDKGDWTNAFHMVMKPLFTTMRDVRRYLNAVGLAVRTIGDEVALVDVLVLEAFRVLLPNVYDRLPSMVEALTSVDHTLGRGDATKSVQAEQIASLFEAGRPYEEETKELCRQIFPASRHFWDRYNYGADSARRWRLDRRVAESGVFAFYLERSLPPETLSAATVERLFASLRDADHLRSMLDGMSSEQLEIALGRLEDFEDRYPIEGVTPSVPVLLNQLHRLREDSRGMFDMGAPIKLTRVVLRLLRRIEDQADREVSLRAILPNVASLSARFELVELVGYREGTGHKLVSEQFASEIEHALRVAILAAPAEALAGERDLLRLFAWTEHIEAEQKVDAISRLLVVAEQDEVLLQLLRSALSATRRQSMGEVATQTEHVLFWDWFVERFGADNLNQRLGSLDHVVRDDRDRVTLATARKYAAGWRPERL